MICWYWRQHGFMESERSRVLNANTECSVVPFWWSSGRGARIYSDRKQSSGASGGDGCLERGTTELSGITEKFQFLIPVLATQVRISVYIFMVCILVKCVRFTAGNYASIKKKKDGGEKKEDYFHSCLSCVFLYPLYNFSICFPLMWRIWLISGFCPSCSVFFFLII